MAKRCGTRNSPCPKPRANWWKQSLGVDWFNHDGQGGSDALRIEKKDTVFINTSTQSNGGTNPHTGRVPPASMPSYLKNSYSNVYMYDIALTFTDAFAPYVPGASGREMGYLDQIIYLLSQVYTTVYWQHRGVGGTKLTTVGEGDSYNREDFKNRAGSARALVVTAVGEGNFNEFVLEDHGETDSLLEASSLLVGSAWEGWINEVRTEVFDTPWFIRITSNSMIPDFPFVLNTQAGQQSVAGLRQIVFNTDYRRTITNEDDSHFGASGAISVGNAGFEVISPVYSITRPGATPVYSSAAVDTTGLLLTLTYGSNLNTHVIPFWKQWTVEVTSGSYVGTRCISAVAISGATVQLTLTVPIRQGDIARVSYTKNLYYRENICDVNGNEVADLSNESITNNSTATARTYTVLQTYNFTASADGFLPTAGCTLSFGETIAGETNCLKVTATATTVNCRDGTTPITIGNTFLLKTRIYKSATPRFGYNTNRSLTITVNTPLQLWLSYDPLVTWGEWFDIEVEKTSTGTDDLRMEAACNISDFYAFANGMRIYSVT